MLGQISYVIKGKKKQPGFHPNVVQIFTKNRENQLKKMQMNVFPSTTVVLT